MNTYLIFIGDASFSCRASSVDEALFYCSKNFYDYNENNIKSIKVVR